MLRFFFLFFISIVLFHSAIASDCKTKSDAPLCPDSGSTILDETYPTQTYVVSVSGFHTRSGYSQETSEKLPTDFIISLMQSYPNGAPEIIVPAATEDFALLVKSLEEKMLASKMTLAEVNKQLSNIRNVATKYSYTWQQDYFESFINPETGRPVVREVSSYQSLDSNYKKRALGSFSSPLSRCEIERGPPLEDFLSHGITSGTNSKSWGNGEMGGNIEGLPGGLCMKGNNQADDFVAQYCGPKEKGNAVELDVGWMEVGHVDEVVKVVPNFPKKKPEECNFSIWLASPKMGLETLKSPSEANKKFIDLSDLTEKEGDQKIKDILNSLAGRQLCNLLKEYEINDTKIDSDASKPKAKGAFLRRILDFTLIQNAHAGVIVDDQVGEQDCFTQLKKVTNSEMAELMEKNDDFMTANNLIQEKMDQNKKNMSAKLQERLPHCKNIKFIETPDLFYAHGLAEVNGKVQLAEPGNARSLFPNPTNSVLANQSMIVPKSPNKAFNLKIKEDLEKQGLKSKFVDTWNYAHTGDGNMHCSSHSLTYCRPRGLK